jgi:hypothetical protein
VNVFNMVTNGAEGMRPDPTPLVLTPVPRYPCDCADDYVSGPLEDGTPLLATCVADGSRVTNGQDDDGADDANPGLVDSTRWYRVDWEGEVGWIAEAWVEPAQRGGAGLATCP